MLGPACLELSWVADMGHEQTLVLPEAHGLPDASGRNSGSEGQVTVVLLPRSA